MVVGRRDLDDVHAAERPLHRDASHRVEQLTTRQSPRFGRAGTGGGARVDDVHVDGEEDGVALVARDGEGLVDHGVEAALDDLAHLE